MSLQATEATVVTLGEDNLILRWVVSISRVCDLSMSDL